MVSFSKRTREFWEVFERIAPKLELNHNNSDRHYEMLYEIDNLCSRLIPDIAIKWSFCRKRKKFVLSFSPELNRDKQILARYAAKHKPKELENWMCYAGKDKSQFNEGDIFTTPHGKFNLIDFKVRAWIKAGVLDIELYHPKFVELEKRKKISVGIFLIDNLIGEYNIELWIGNYNFVDKFDEGTYFDLLKLPDMFDNYLDKSGFDKTITPDQVRTSFNREVREDWTELRDDIFNFTTTYPKLFFDYGKRNFLENIGADYIYIAIENKELEKLEKFGRADFIEYKLKQNEDTIEAFILGHATGKKYSYIDMIVFDGDNSIEIIKIKLKHILFIEKIKIGYFSLDKKDTFYY